MKIIQIITIFFGNEMKIIQINNYNFLFLEMK